ncbi:hypothetical protein [Methylobacterium sp. D54C]
MAEINLLSPRFSREGAERLVKALEQALIANVDLGPRWPQIRALGLSLRQLSQDLDREIEQIPSRLDTTPEAEAFRDRLYQLAKALSRLSSIAEAYPSDA